MAWAHKIIDLHMIQVGNFAQQPQPLTGLAEGRVLLLCHFKRFWGDFVDAVDRLRERMMIYQAWATKVDGEEYGLAKWAVGQMGQVCQQLSEQGLPTETEQAFQAQLFLGYMARPVSGKNSGTQN